MSPSASSSSSFDHPAEAPASAAGPTRLHTFADTSIRELLRDPATSALCCGEREVREQILRARRADLLAILKERFPVLPEDVPSRVEAITDGEVLQQAVRRALRVSRLEEFAELFPWARTETGAAPPGPGAAAAPGSDRRATPACLPEMVRFQAGTPDPGNQREPSQSPPPHGADPQAGRRAFRSIPSGGSCPNTVPDEPSASALPVRGAWKPSSRRRRV
jgi:hypothetical protein